MTNSQARKTGRDKIKVVIIDDHPIVRSGMRSLIDLQPDMIACGEAGNGAEAVAVIRREKPDVALVDLSLGRTSGLDLLGVLRKEFPSVALLVLTMHHEFQYAERCLKAGAKGYMMKTEAPEAMTKSIRTVHAGYLSISPAVQERLLTKVVGKEGAPESSIDRLSDREKEVFEWIGRGKTIHEIAGELRVSVNTVEAHREHIKKKLNYENTNELLYKAVCWVQQNSL